LSFSDELTLVLVGVLIACVAQRELGERRTRFESRWLVKLGELSFNFYLVHATVMYVFVTIFGELEMHWANLAWYPIVLVGGLLAALTLHVCVEKPFEKRIRGYADKFESKGIQHS